MDILSNGGIWPLPSTQRRGSGRGRQLSCHAHGQGAAFDRRDLCHWRMLHSHQRQFFGHQKIRSRFGWWLNIKDFFKEFLNPDPWVDDPIWRAYLQMGWNHQLEMLVKNLYHCLISAMFFFGGVLSLKPSWTWKQEAAHDWWLFRGWLPPATRFDCLQQVPYEFWPLSICQSDDCHAYGHDNFYVAAAVYMRSILVP